MRYELAGIKNKIIDRILFFSVLYVIIPYATSILRIVQIGWHNIFLIHTTLFLLFLALFFFRKKMNFNTKINALTVIFTLVGVVGLYLLGFAGAFYYCFVPVVLNVILQGRRAALIYFGIISVLYLMIAWGYLSHRIVLSIDLNTYHTLPTGWITVIAGILFVAFVILISTSELYGYFLKTIEEKEKSARNLAENRQQLQHVFDNSPAIMMLLNERTEIININRPGLQFANAGPDEIKYKRSGDALRCIYGLQHNEGCQRSTYCKDCIIRNTVTDTLKTGKTHQMIEADFIMLEGQREIPFTFLLSTSVISSRPEKTVLVTLENITERKWAREALAESERKHKKIFNATNEAIIIQDADTGILLDVNDTMLTMFGYENKKEIIQSDILRFSAVEKGYDKPKVNQKIAEVNQKKAVTFEWLAQKKDGTNFWIDVSLKSTVINGENRILAVIRDIDDRKQAQLALKERDKTLRTVFSKSADGVSLMEDNIFVDCNESVIKLLKLDSKEDIIGKYPWEISPEYQPDGLKSYDKALDMINQSLEKGYHRFEWLHLTKQGNHVFFDIVLTPIFINNKQIVHCVWRDITEKKRIDAELEKHRNHLEKLVKERTEDIIAANEELQTANEELFEKSQIIESQNAELMATLQHLKETQSQLLQAEKMASLGILTAGVAHEINNPLNFIMGGYVGLEDYFSESDNLQHEEISVLLKSIKTGVDRATAIVNSLNQFSRSRETYDEICDIHTIIDNCLVVLQNEIKNRIRIKKNYSRDSIKIKGNMGKLHQVFLNILNNSIQAIPDEGAISILTRNQDNQIMTEISDTGLGIKKENLLKITDPFFTTKDPGEGTGLGLSITYKIIQEHKGNLKFESELNKGTTAKILLPKNI